MVLNCAAETYKNVSIPTDKDPQMDKRVCIIYNSLYQKW